VEAKLTALRADVHLSSIFVRDYLLDLEREHGPEYREQLAEFRRTNMATLTELRPLVGQDDQISVLQAELDEYWETFGPLFDWSPSEKIARSEEFLQKEVVPRREAVLAIAKEVEELNNANLSSQRSEVADGHAALAAGLDRVRWQAVLLGLLVSFVVVFRLRFLERRSDEAECQMRELSQRLVNAQEEERKNLSRELHDHVAQVLTGLRMELGRLERLTAPTIPTASTVVAGCKELVDDMFRTVRDLALGLRPSMLDDFGLQAALEWHVRDFTGRYSVKVDLNTQGDFDTLPDRHRTCVFRVVQEAMTNCIRHAHARAIQIVISALDGQLRVSVTDDGVGLDPARRRNGLGLMGIEERVKELGGTVAISRRGTQGTTVAIRLPIPQSQEVLRARAAG
jgi:signal transduction histidine kinase